MDENNRLPIPIYTTSGDTGGFLVYPYVYNLGGDWIGWVTRKKKVYSVYGKYVGWLSDDPRILRKRTQDYRHPDLTPPPGPPRFLIPATVPLPPLMPELSFSTVDVLEERPELLPTTDSFAFEDEA